MEPQHLALYEKFNFNSGIWYEEYGMDDNWIYSLIWIKYTESNEERVIETRYFVRLRNLFFAGISRFLLKSICFLLLSFILIFPRNHLLKWKFLLFFLQKVVICHIEDITGNQWFFYGSRRHLSWNQSARHIIFNRRRVTGFKMIRFISKRLSDLLRLIVSSELFCTL